MIIGMCPGVEENTTGLPFVGRSGRILDKTLNDLGNPKVYITNLVKCYVKPGTKLKDKWIEQCIPFLLAQIKIIKPKIIVTLGADASFRMLKNTKYKYMKDIRGKIFRNNMNHRILPTYHPSWVLRRGGYGTESWKIMRGDLEKAIKEK
jgi:DNA polymerase